MARTDNVGRAHTMFRIAYNGQPNFMTPEIISRDGAQLPDGRFVAFEYSKGTGMNNQPIYGCTVVIDNKPQYDLSTVCQSHREAQDHSQDILDKLREADQ